MTNNTLMNLDETIVGIVLSQYKLENKGASFEDIYEELHGVMGVETPCRLDIFNLLGDLDTEGLVTMASGGGYASVDLDQYAKDLGIWDLMESL